MSHFLANVFPGRSTAAAATFLLAAVAVLPLATTVGEERSFSAAVPANLPTFDDHAPQPLSAIRRQARLLHEAIHGSLQVMHRDFFRAGQTIKIPSHSLEDVFKELEKTQGVGLRWISVNTKAMNIDNEPQTPFEKDAAQQLKAGEPLFEQLDAEQYQFAAPIRLSATCLSCHVSGRSDNADRMAALVITTPTSLIQSRD